MIRKAKGSPTITVRLPLPLVNRLNLLIEYSSRSISDIIRAALIEYLDHKLPAGE